MNQEEDETVPRSFSGASVLQSLVLQRFGECHASHDIPSSTLDYFLHLNDLESALTLLELHPNPYSFVDLQHVLACSSRKDTRPAKTISSPAQVQYSAPQLLLAIPLGSLRLVKILVHCLWQRHRYTVNDCCSWDYAPLRSALLFCGRDDIVQFLIHRETPWKDQALNLAVKQGMLSTVQCLVNHGASVNLHSQGGDSPLMAAVQYSCVVFINENGKRSIRSASIIRLTMVQYLVEQGAQVDAQDMCGRTALLMALMQQSADEPLLEYLMDRSNLALADHLGCTALHYAARCASPKVMARILQQPGATVHARNFKGQTALLVASRMHCLENVQYLVEVAGANVHDQDYTGSTALHYAAQRGNLPTVHYLVSYGNVNVQDSMRGWTPAMQAVVCRGRENEIALFLLQQTNAQIHWQDKAGETILHKAARVGHLSVVQFLLENRENEIPVNACNQNGKTALDIALEECHFDVVGYLQQFKNHKTEDY